jgi:uncharacterized damage-inducible protein DinB
VSGDAWHGPALAELLVGISARDAAARPVPGAHSIWELVLHLTGWAREVTRRLQGGTPGLPPEGDWPAVVAVTEPAWDTARADLVAAHDRLMEEVTRLPDGALDQRVGQSRDQPLATGVTVRQTLHGVAQHDAYHGGQIALLKKALAAAHVSRLS